MILQSAIKISTAPLLHRECGEDSENCVQICAEWTVMLLYVQN